MVNLRFIAGVVDRVIDGDTIRVRLDGARYTVRLTGIDTPETKHPTLGVQPFGPEASAYTTARLTGATVRLDLDPAGDDIDAYGRLLRYVVLASGENVNATLIRDGYDTAIRMFPYSRHREFLQLETRARRGRWADAERPATLPRVPRSRTGPSVWSGRDPRRTGGQCPATARPPLRDGASHEAEGRRGARGGSAGRVRAPAGRPRLLRQILDELVPGVEQFLFVDDVVAVEDGAGLVAGQEHGDALGDAGADQVAGGGAAAVVEEAGRYASRLTGGAPRRAPAADGDAVAVEDQRAVGVAACPPSREGLGNGVRDRENPPHQRLRAGGREPDDAAGVVDLVPGEAEDLVLAPAGVVGEVEDILPRGGQVGADGEVFVVLEEALAGGILPQAVGEAGHGVEPAPVDGEGAHAVEGRGFPIDGAGGRPGGVPGELVLADLVGGQRGGPRVAAEARGEMGDPAAGGALGPELPDVVVLRLGVDQSGVILVHTLTEATGDDTTTALDLLTAVEGPLVRVTADAVYETAGARGATVSGHGPRSPARDRTITLVETLGRRQWKKASGCHRQSRVENTFFRYKSIIGDGLRARSPAGQGSEVVLGCEILNRMTELGRPVSYRIGQ